MSKSIAQINKQIEALQRQAATLKKAAIQRAREEIETHGLTIEDLFGKNAPKGVRPGQKIKYADGTGNTWAGVGKRPMWLREALEAGATLESFLVSPAVDAAKPAARKRAPSVPKAAKPIRAAAPSAPVSAAQVAAALPAPATFPPKKVREPAQRKPAPKKPAAKKAKKAS